MIIVLSINFSSKTFRQEGERESEVNREHCLQIMYLRRKLLYTNKKKHTMEKRHKNNSFRSRPTLSALPIHQHTTACSKRKTFFKLLKKLKNGADSERDITNNIN